MELPSRLLEQITFNTRAKIEEHMLVVMNKSAHEKHLSRTLQTNNKQFKLAITFLSGYKGTFNVTNTNNKFYFKKLMKMDSFKSLYFQELMKLNHSTMKLNELSLMKNIIQKLITHSKSNKSSQH